MKHSYLPPLGKLRRLTCLVFSLILLATTPAQAHTGVSLIVDTDMAADDARALALLLASPSCDVEAVLTSDGVCPPDIGATNVSRMLRFLGHEDVAVGCGRSLAVPPPAFRPNATGLDWVQLGAPILPPGGWPAATNLLRQVLQDDHESLIYVCLGPLTTLADTLESAPALATKVSTVVWFGTPPNASEPGWNARRDAAALRRIAATGLRVEVTGWPDDATVPAFDTALLEELRSVDSPAAKLIVRLLGSGRGAELVRANHLRLWDDLVALRLLNPELVTRTPVAGFPQWTQLTATNAEAVRGAFAAALHPVPPRATVILADFPTDPARLLPDVRDPARLIQDRHGLEEWKAAVLTSELHRHLGTYSIVGAKMGLRAREHFNVALDELRVESHAGLKPPLSCLNDGLQVATGASLGRGTISVPTNGPPACEAIFRHGERQLRLRLKPEFARRIADDMAELVRRHGGVTPAYFQDVRTVSLEHWLDFDRHTMFDETEETAPAIP
jgi:pyrimidine-specific ribonucleoside hydrolase